MAIDGCEIATANRIHIPTLFYAVSSLSAGTSGTVHRKSVVFLMDRQREGRKE